MLKNYKQLFNLDATIAKELFESCSHPWDVLPLIKEFILKLIPTLGDEYEEVDENVYVHKGITEYDKKILKPILKKKYQFTSNIPL